MHTHLLFLQIVAGLAVIVRLRALIPLVALGVVGLTVEELLRRKVIALLKARGWSQTDFVDCLATMGFKRSQAWASRKLTGVQSFRTGELQMLATVFRVTVPELFFDEYGQWDRRSGSDRRKGERRQSQQRIYDPSVEPSPAIGRLAFPKPED